MSDKGFLERCFPSLRDNVTPVEKFGHLPQLTIPLDVTIHPPLKTVAEIEDAMRVILQSIPEEDRNMTLVIGLDSEYNVEISAQGYVTGRGQTAILQIAFGKSIFILQVSLLSKSMRLTNILSFRSGICWLVALFLLF
jgi:hypothetical protein